MGTRNLTCVVVDEKMKVSQYCQWDGYPEGQGSKIYNIMRKIVTSGKLPQFKEAVRNLKEITAEEVQALWKQVGADDTGWIDMDTSKKFKEKWPHLSRDCGADVLQLIYEGKVKEVKLDLEFMADSLFCEWAYVVDLDNEFLEVYTGFQTQPHKQGRFADMELEKPGGGGTQYYPIALIKVLSLVCLPKTEKEFLKLIPEDEEEEVEVEEPSIK